MKKIIILGLVATLCATTIACNAPDTDKTASSSPDTSAPTSSAPAAATAERTEPVKPSQLIALTGTAVGAVDFSALAWGMSRADALAVLKLDESMLTPVVLPPDVISQSDAYTVNEPRTAGVPDILEVTFARDDEAIKPGSFICMKLACADAAALDAAIAKCTDIYGKVEAKEEIGRDDTKTGNLVQYWRDTRNPVSVLGDRAQKFVDAYVDAIRDGSPNAAAIKDVPADEFKNACATSARVVTYGKPDETGAHGYIELMGAWETRIAQFLDGTSAPDPSTRSVKPSELITLTGAAVGSVDFSALAWGMSKVDALAVLKLDESMLEPVVLPTDVISKDNMYKVKAPRTDGVPDILQVTFSGNEGFTKPDSFVSMTIGYTDKAELDAAIAQCNTVYGEGAKNQGKDEKGELTSEFLYTWRDKQNPVTVLGDRAQEFADAYIEWERKNSDQPDKIRDMPAQQMKQLSTTRANIVVYDKPIEGGYCGCLQLTGGVQAMVAQFLDGTNALDSTAVKPSELIPLTGAVDFSALAWGMSRADALAVLKLDESMLAPVAQEESADNHMDVFTTKEPRTAGVPDILAVTFAREGYGVKAGSLVSMTIGYTDKAELDAAIAQCKAVYGAGKQEQLQDGSGKATGETLYTWSDKVSPIAAAGDRAQAFADAYGDMYRKNADDTDEIVNVRAEQLKRVGVTSANVVAYDKPDKDGYCGRMQLTGGVQAMVAQFLEQ